MDDIRYNIRITEQEKKALFELAEKYGTTAAELCRQIIRKTVMPEKPCLRLDNGK
jgi:replication initiation and membrane attachment protein DnaB